MVTLSSGAARAAFACSLEVANSCRRQGQQIFNSTPFLKGGWGNSSLANSSHCAMSRRPANRREPSANLARKNRAMSAKISPAIINLKLFQYLDQKLKFFRKLLE
jgi:hypothetical protein